MVSATPSAGSSISVLNVIISTPIRGLKVQLGFIVLTTLVWQRVTSSSVVWSEPSVVAKQGDSLALVCTVYGAEFFDVVRLTLTPRSVAVADTGPPVRWTISDNDEVKPEFAHLTRYKIAFRIVGFTATVQLNITGLKGEDSGILGCHKLQSVAGQAEQSALARVKILVPISSVTIVAVSPTGNDVPIGTANAARVTLTQGQMNGVACIVVVDGTANAPPEVEITIGDNDETDAFRYNSTSGPIDGTAPSGDRPAHYQTVVRLAYVTDEPEIEFNRKTMRCTAVQTGFPKVVTSAQLEVRYAPIINCTKNQFRPDPGQRTTLMCMLRANPSSDDVTWSYVGGAKVDEDLHADPNVHIDYQLFDGDLSESSLTIKYLLHEYYQTYCLTATNDVGQRRALVTLSDSSDLTTVPPPPPPPREQRHKHVNSIKSSTPVHVRKAAQKSGTPRPLIALPASSTNAAVTLVTSLTFVSSLNTLLFVMKRHQIQTV